MIKITITIGEIEAIDKTRGALLCVTNRNTPTEEELIMEALVFKHVKMIGQEISKQRGATVNMIEGEGGKKNEGRKSITSRDRGNPGSL